MLEYLESLVCYFKSFLLVISLFFQENLRSEHLLFEHNNTLIILDGQPLFQKLFDYFD